MKKIEPPTAPTVPVVDPQVKSLLEMIQKQSEIHAQEMNEMRVALRTANEENKKRAKEIELLGKTLAGTSVRDSETLITDDYSSVPEDSMMYSETGQRQAANRPPLTNTRADEEQATAPTAPMLQERPTLRAKDAIRYIPSLNGDDDVGVEDFIKEIRSLKNMCMEQGLLLKAIKVEKITGKAAQSIRNIPIETYAELYEALRTNVAIQASADEFNEQLRELKQGSVETVQSFNIRFRRILNKLTYAITNEYPQPITRRVMMEATMKRVVKIYINGLKREIGHMIFTSKPNTLIEAEKEAADVERYLREERHETFRRNMDIRTRDTRQRPAMTNAPRNPATNYFDAQARQIPSPTTRMPSRQMTQTFNRAERSPLSERALIKCFKCNRLGHTANQCVNFRSPSQLNKPPLRVNHLNEQHPPDRLPDDSQNQYYESTQLLDDYQPSYTTEEDILSTPEQESTSLSDQCYETHPEQFQRKK